MPDRADLPAHPLLRPHTPVLDRNDGSVQVGLDAGAAVVLDRSTAETLLPRLDGRTSRSRLRSAGLRAGISVQNVEAVLTALHRAGLLVDPARSGWSAELAGTGAVVRLIGLGPLGQRLLPLLLGAGLTVYAAGLERPGSPSPTALPRTELTDGSRGTDARLRLVNHWSKPDDREVDLTVVAPDTVEPDRLITDVLLRADQPHLVLRAGGSTVTVGPLVLPGRTACVRCTDLTRGDADAGWLSLLPQLVRLRLPTRPLLLSWAAACGAAQVLAHLHDAVPESAGATLELGRDDYLMVRRAWPVHARCGCAWAATTEWGP